MLALDATRKHAPFGTLGVAVGRSRYWVNAFGNALGSSIADGMQSPSQAETQGQGPWSDAGYRNGSDIDCDNYTAARAAEQQLLADNRSALNAANVTADSAYYSAPTPEQLQAAFRQSERDYRSTTEKSVAGSGYMAQGGDSISRIVGSSDPQAIGNFMRANNLTSDRIEVGRNYFRPDSTTAYGDASDLGQFALNQGNERIAAASRSETQREMNRFAAMREGSSAAPVWNMRDASAAAMRGQSSSGDVFGSLAEGASNAQYVAAMLDGGMAAGGKAAGAAKLLPAGALQQARVEALMAAKNLEAAQGLIKGPTAKSALAMAEYGGKYAGTFKAVPYLGATLSVAEEANRVYRADGWQETTKVVAVGTGNWWFDGMATTGGAWAGAKAGTAVGAAVGSVVPVVGIGVGAVVGGVVGTVGGGLFGHWIYDTHVAPEARALVIGEKFRDGN